MNKSKSDTSGGAGGERWYRQLFEKSGAASIIIEPDMTIAMANVEFEKLSGFPRAAIEGRMKWTDFIAAGDLEKMIAYHYGRRKGDTAVPDEYECRVVNRSGNLRDIYIKVAMLPDGIRSIASFMEITDLKKAQRDLRKSQAALNGIIEAAGGLIYASSPDYRIVFMNRAMMARVGRDATGEWCYALFHGRNTPCADCPLQTAAAGRPVRREFQSKIDGRWYYAVTSPAADPDGEVTTIETLMIDITERKQAEAALVEQADYFRRENIRLRSSMKERYRFGALVGKSAAMQAVYENILRAASGTANVIIYGESGTGKELAARAIHDAGSRADGPFVTVNCGAIPENLMESEFFGHKKGAFTGADRDRPGHLAFADGGTAFLDEIGEISPAMQAKLLRVMDGQGFSPVGSGEPHNPDIRIIAATNREPRLLLEEGRMREDFFFRLHVIPVSMPPLRERKEDLVLLAEHFLSLYAESQAVPSLTGVMTDAMQAYDWPGNVRELQNVIRRYITLGRFELTGEGYPVRRASGAPAPAAPADGNLREALAEYEKTIILSALEANQWRRGDTARALGINRRTLFKKLRQYGVK